MKNLPEFKALIERYESVTIEEIKSKWDKNGVCTAGHLIGFGSSETCSLCLSVTQSESISPDCSKCVWRCITSKLCNHGTNTDSYRNIFFSESTTDLLTAFRARAAYMRQVLKDGGIK